mmetsp:Transcript_117041/g.303497  ORF Transcript_117041/g.303497 Transcript_117041/m.303497 type:complete len:555 (-) Transcript_117041:67-1731(-)|eukprot:CAMPEP_0115218778 /NCGR_PEP_ID=MMETSP0270-20121206/26571_1 /TAXON_ID=71861 /ORGANISM="Scrippsiella trochoidea, Strain CCMP3099" /LENGTH=554 /DNA_ID=CAMNT_0002632741 /DNA_START=58 /DNA_END=1722 /DNA_ORIENTATION=-
MASPRSPMRSPARSSASPKAPVGDATVSLQVTQFFDDWFHRVMRTSLGKTWTRSQAVVSALDLFALNGVPLTREDIQWMASQHEDFMIPELIRKMPLSIRENFETLAQQLQMLLVTTSGVRVALDSGSPDVIAEVMEEQDHSGIKDQILKAAVIKASQEVKQAYRCQDTWVKATEKRLQRLTRSAELAQVAHQQLLKVESQLESLAPISKAKSKKALMGFLESNMKNVMQSAVAQWWGLAVKNREERALRKRFDAELEAKEKLLFSMKQRSIENIRNCLMRQARENDETLIADVFKGWLEEVGGAKRDAAEAEALKELQSNLDKFTEEKTAKAKKIFAQMSAHNESAVLVSSFQGWRQAAAEEKKERELEAEVKEAADKLNEFMKGKKAEARSRLERMLMQGDSALLQKVMQSWLQTAIENRDTRNVQSQIKHADQKFKFLMTRQSTIARNTQGRINKQLEAIFLMKVMNAWERESTFKRKLHKIDDYYKGKVDSKRKQLDRVRNKFREFADKLEEGLERIDEVETPGTRSRTKGGLTKGEHSVSLPSINLRQH